MDEGRFGRKGTLANVWAQCGSHTRSAGYRPAGGGFIGGGGSDTGNVTVPTHMPDPVEGVGGGATNPPGRYGWDSPNELYRSFQKVFRDPHVPFGPRLAASVARVAIESYARVL